jgi:UDP-glucose 4-epimerase
MDSEETSGQVFNIGNGKEISIKELAGMVKDLTQSSSEIVTIPYDKAYEEGFEDMPRRMPDITKIRKAIGFEPTLGIRAILEKVIEYERKCGIFK